MSQALHGTGRLFPHDWSCACQSCASTKVTYASGGFTMTAPDKHITLQNDANMNARVESAALRATRPRSEEPWYPFRVNDTVAVPVTSPIDLPESYSYPAEIAELALSISECPTKHTSRLPVPVMRKAVVR